MTPRRQQSLELKDPVDALIGPTMRRKRGVHDCVERLLKRGITLRYIHSGKGNQIEGDKAHTLLLSKLKDRANQDLDFHFGTKKPSGKHFVQFTDYEWIEEI